MFLIILFLITTFLSSSSLAVSPTPTIPAQTDEIQKIREVVQQKVKEKLQEIVNPVTTKKAIIGKIIQIDNSQITIDYQNNPRVLAIDSATVFIDLNRNKTSFSKVKIGQDILVLVLNDSNLNTFTAKRIVFIDMATIETKKTVVIGKIVDLSKTSPIFTLIPSRNKNNLFQIKTDTKTLLTDKNGQKLNLSSLKSGQKIIAVLRPDLKMTKTYYAINLYDFESESPTPTSKP